MIDIRGLSYFVSQIENLSQWQRYAEDVLGMQVHAGAGRWPVRENGRASVSHADRRRQRGALPGLRLGAGQRTGVPGRA